MHGCTGTLRANSQGLTVEREEHRGEHGGGDDEGEGPPADAEDRARKI